MAARFRLLPAVLVTVALLAGACTPASPATPTASPAAPASSPTAAPPTPTAAPAFPVTLTDDEGTEVTIAAEPQKIVSLTPATTEILFAIGAGSRVIGKVEDVASFPPESVSIPDVATFGGVDVEEIVTLGADLVIAAGVGLSQGPAVEQLRRADVPVLVIYPTTVDGALAGVRLIGQATGATAEATELADGMDAQLEALAAAAATAGTKPRVFYEIDVTNGIFTPPADSIYGEMFRLAGAEPISGDANYSITLESLVAADPEVILLGDAAYGQTPETVKARPGWDVMTAVQNDRIHPIDDIVVTRPGPRLVDGLRALIEAIHPDLALPSPATAAQPAFALPVAA